MSIVRVNCFGISLDGFAAGPDQDLEHPLGHGGEVLHEWQFQSRHFREMLGMDGGETGIDDDFVVRGADKVGAWIIGRNMFGPVRGPWPDESWRGWWGEKPPFECPVFVLTHHPRESLVMANGTTFHFVTEGIEAALAQARDAAQGADIRLGGGVSTLRQYLSTGLVDFMHLALCPVFLGSGENVFAGLNLPALGYRVRESVKTDKVIHLLIDRGA